MKYVLCVLSVIVGFAFANASYGCCNSVAVASVQASYIQPVAVAQVQQVPVLSYMAVPNVVEVQAVVPQVAVQQVAVQQYPVAVQSVQAAAVYPQAVAVQAAPRKVKQRARSKSVIRTR